MSDYVVTVPKWFWPEWIAEGDAAGEPETGEEYWFTIACRYPPQIAVGDRLYIVAHDRLRGWAPVTRTAIGEGGGDDGQGSTFTVLRRGGAVACTISERIQGFRGFRRVWWSRSIERPFPDWKTCDVAMPERRSRKQPERLL